MNTEPYRVVAAADLADCYLLNHLGGRAGRVVRALPQMEGSDLIAAKLISGRLVTVSLARLAIDTLGRLWLPEMWEDDVVESGSLADRDWVAVGTSNPTASEKVLPLSVRESARSDIPRGRR